MAKIKTNLEEDAKNILSFMASNGLMANKAKTEFLVLNERDKSDPTLKELFFGDEIITRTSHTKLLGMMFIEAAGNVH